MKKFEFESNGSVWRLEEDSNKNLGRVLLKYITEQQASDVVESGDATPYLCSGFVGYRDYMSYEDDYRIDSCVESLHSLLKSKGIWIFGNPIENWKDELHYDMSMEEAEEKTFYNPVLFKITP